ncbi:hypothetical protein A2960_01890 [Candidatus Gottesmanbacteria bacterium RIFCSPLOWO2_01_FULL_39_12b]|uniref:Solute-binding protein family 5 domain-containing protein n=1 Tax=Candidatus Gottesmanbacteria bacterium RIFCSPLOWO2_01_FULL_39_12b TaxID=1798388 RepID=A0A1F6AQB4_9BACT|nr:MAG: hypothetical protein A2960_01890 [Candidatus Gottesmanbacteria bacterium RIFCSPLOWO2_01_FULL_39_12b]
MRRQLQFVALFIQTFWERHYKYILVSAILGFFSTLFIIQSYPIISSITFNRNYKIGLVGRFSETTLPLFIQNEISIGLTSLTPSGIATASIAQSWDVDSKGVNYLFHLKQNLVWHDGKRFEAKDVNYNLKDVIFTPLNETTLKVTLKEPYAPLLVLLSQPLLRDKLVGLNSLKISRLIYKGDYISEITLLPNKSSSFSKTYKFYPNQNEAILAFKLGEVNSLKEISDYKELENWKNIKIDSINYYDRYIGLFFDLKNNLFKEKEIRQAFAYTMPKIESLEKAFTPISPLSWAYSPKIRLYNYDPDTASKILSKSQISSPSSQITLTTFVTNLDIAQKIVDEWNKLGLNVRIKVENSIPSDFQILLWTQAIPVDPDQYQYWQSTQEETNITHYSNQKIDKLLEDGRKIYDLESRKKIYADFQRYIVDDVPVIFLYYPKVYNINRN